MLNAEVNVGVRYSNSLFDINNCFIYFLNMNTGPRGKQYA